MGTDRVTRLMSPVTPMADPMLTVLGAIIFVSLTIIVVLALIDTGRRR